MHKIQYSIGKNHGSERTQIKRTQNVHLLS